MATSRRATMASLRRLPELPQEDVPKCLRPSWFFDFKAHPFEHEELFNSAHDVVDVLNRIHDYMETWLSKQTADAAPFQPEAAPKQVGAKADLRVIGDAATVVWSPDVILGPISPAGAPAASPPPVIMVSSGAQVLGGTFDLRKGGVWLGEGVTVEPGATIQGPSIVGAGTTLRGGTYMRSDVIVGKQVLLRGELKNSVLMDTAELSHPGYCGDSIIGYAGHFGFQALTANLGLLKEELKLKLPDDEGGEHMASGRQKIGLILGDESQLGCNSVSDPGTMVGPRTIVYPLTRLAGGFYGPDQIIKNKPEEAGVIVRTPMRFD